MVNFLKICQMTDATRCEEMRETFLFMDGLLLKIESGDLTIEIADKVAKVSCGEMIYISESTPWRVTRMSKKCVGEVMVMNTDNIQKNKSNAVIINHFQHLQIDKHAREIARLSQYQEKLKGVEEKDSATECDAIMSLIIDELQRYKSTLGPQWNINIDRDFSEGVMFCEFVRGIKSNDRFERNVERHAARLNTTHTNLTQLCNAEVALSPKEIIIRIMIELAQIKITRNTLRTSKVSTYFGYPDASNFVKVFKERTGMTPTSCLAD